MVKTAKQRVRKDTGEVMGGQKNGQNGQEGAKPAPEEGAKAATHPDVLVEDGKMLLPVTRDRVYRILMPDKPKELDPKFDIPDSPLGRAARNYLLLEKAEKEVKTDKAMAKVRLLRELKRERKTDLTLGVGRAMAQIAVNHVDEKEEVKVKWA